MRGPGPTQHFPISGFGGNSTQESSSLGNLPGTPLCHFLPWLQPPAERQPCPLRAERAESWESGTSGANLGLFPSHLLLCLLVSHRYSLRLTTCQEGVCARFTDGQILQGKGRGWHRLRSAWSSIFARGPPGTHRQPFVDHPHLLSAALCLLQLCSLCSEE